MVKTFPGIYKIIAGVALFVLIAWPLKFHMIAERERVRQKANGIRLNYVMPAFDDLRAFAENPSADSRIPAGYINYYEKVVSAFPQIAEARGVLGLCYYYAGKTEDAAESLSAAVKLNPQFFWLSYNLGLMYYHAGRFQDAAEVLKIALKSKPDISVKTIFTSKIYQQILGNPMSYQDQIVTGLKLGYGNVVKILALTYYRLGQEAQDRKDLPLAYNYIMESIKIYPLAESLEMFESFKPDKDAMKEIRELSKSLQANRVAGASIEAVLLPRIF